MSKRMTGLAIFTVALACCITGVAQARDVRAFITVHNPSPLGGPGFAESIADQQWLKLAVGGEDPDFTRFDWWDNLPEPNTMEAIFVGKAISSSPEYSVYIWEVVLPNTGGGAANRIALEVSPLNAGDVFPAVKPRTRLLIEEFLWEPYFWSGGYLDPTFGAYVWYGTLLTK